MKILLFIGLKIFEISTMILIPYGLGRLISLVKFIDKWFEDCPYWIRGFFLILAIFVAFIILMILLEICERNWSLVEKIFK